MLAIVGGNLIDGAGAPTVQDVTVLVDGERIVEVGPRLSVPIPEGAEALDAAGHTIMPGLIDVHDHLASGGYGLTGRWGMDEPLSLLSIRTSQVIEDTLAAGYTTVRDAGGLDAGFKMAVEEGLIKGPRLIVSVNIMSPTGGIEDKVSGSGHRKVILGHDPLAPDGVADGVDGVRAKVRELIRCGADQIKFATTGGRPAARATARWIKPTRWTRPRRWWTRRRRWVAAPCVTPSAEPDCPSPSRPGQAPLSTAATWRRIPICSR